MILRYAIIAMLCLGIVSCYTLPSTTIKGTLDMYGNKILNSTTPVNDTDVATKGYADSVASGSYLPLTGGTLTGGVNFGGFSLDNLSNPVNLTDAATMGYLHTQLISIPTPVNVSDAANKSYVDTAVSSLASTSDLWAKTNKSGDVMDSSANLTFVGGSIINGSLDIAYARDYGVIPDDETDDSAALALLSASGYRIFQLPEGELTLDDAKWTVPGDVIVRGAGKGVTVFNTSGAGAYIEIAGNRTVLSDFMVYSEDATARKGIYIAPWQHYWSLDRVWVKNIAPGGSFGTYQGYGIYVSDNCWIGTIRECLTESCFVGLYLGAGANDIQSIGSEYTYSTADGVLAANSGTHGLSFIGSDFEGNGRYGVRFYEVDQATIYGCYLEHNEHSAIWIDGSDAAHPSGVISVFGSTFYENGPESGDAAITIYLSNKTLVEGCRFAGNHSSKGAIEISSSLLNGDTDRKGVTLVENKYDEMTGAGAGVYVTNPEYANIIDSRYACGSTTHRPAIVGKGQVYYDTTLAKLIVYSGSGWIDVDGSGL